MDKICRINMKIIFKKMFALHKLEFMSKMCIIAMKIMLQCKINMEIESKYTFYYCINPKNLFVGQFLHCDIIFNKKKVSL